MSGTDSHGSLRDPTLPDDGIGPLRASTSSSAAAGAPTPTSRFRLRFAKTGPLRFVGHQDLLRVWDRLLRRSGLSIRYTEGFHQRPKVSLPLALPLGVEGQQEVIELEFDDVITADELQDRLNAVSVAGLTIAAVEPITGKSPTVGAIEYSFTLPTLAWRQIAQVNAEKLLATATWPVVRQTPGKPTRAVDLRPLIESVMLQPTDADQTHVRCRLRVVDGSAARIGELLQALGIDALLMEGMVVARSLVELQTNRRPNQNDAGERNEHEKRNAHQLSATRGNPDCDP